MWTRFMDMHSGGSRKLKWAYIYIEAPEAGAKVIFYNMFNRSPDRVTCTCCGPDYSIDSAKSLAQVTGFDRNCDNKGEKYIEKPRQMYTLPGARKAYYTLIPLRKYIMQKEVLVIYKSAIKAKDRIGSVPDEGYHWID